MVLERRVRSKVGREIHLTKWNINKRVQAAAESGFRKSETLQVHDEDVGRSPQVHLLASVRVLFAVRASAERRLKMKKRANSQLGALTTNLH